MVLAQYIIHWLNRKGKVSMLTEQEIINNALKEMLFLEELTAEKYMAAAEQTMQPNLKEILKGMEMAARNNYKNLSEKMSQMNIT